MTLSIRSAIGSDRSLILRFIAELAAYEKLSDAAKATEADIVRDFFCEQPRVFCEIAEWDGQPVGFAVWFYTYSTFQGRHGIWLEDIYVSPEARGRGIGKGLLAQLAQRCVNEGLGRLEWWVLDWNQPSIDFYLAQGGTLQDAWTKVRLDGAALRRLGTA
ncbi:MAG TPA: GNAT family N-acetyltransferase [Devosiaceae bacterium]|nr:GNAT family N-acetyltransferase [Devosiaceae bacterium]